MVEQRSNFRLAEQPRNLQLELTQQPGPQEKEIAHGKAETETQARSPDRKLSLVEFDNRFLLVWARYGVVGPFDEPATIMKALKLKAK